LGKGKRVMYTCRTRWEKKGVGSRRKVAGAGVIAKASWDKAGDHCGKKDSYPQRQNTYRNEPRKKWQHRGEKQWATLQKEKGNKDDEHPK